MKSALDQPIGGSVIRPQPIAPDAVTPSGEFELAATDRAALVKTIPILGGQR